MDVHQSPKGELDGGQSSLVPISTGQIRLLELVMFIFIPLIQTLLSFVVALAKPDGAGRQFTTGQLQHIMIDPQFATPLCRISLLCHDQHLHHSAGGVRGLCVLACQHEGVTNTCFHACIAFRITPCCTDLPIFQLFSPLGSVSRCFGNRWPGSVSPQVRSGFAGIRFRIENILHFWTGIHPLYQNFLLQIAAS
jgi:hypothetical protein